MTRILLFLFMAAITGCSYVSSQNPVGLNNYPIDTDEWNGTWLHDEGTVTINTVDELKGVVEIAWIEKKDKKLKFESVKAIIMKGNKSHYANIADESNNKPGNNYFWVKIKKEKNRIILWHPSVAAFAKAVEKNKVKAIINKDITIDGKREIIQSIKLIDSPENIVNLLERNGSKYFAWEAPVTLTRIKD